MEKTLAIIFLIIFLFFIIFILRTIFLKGILHFKLLKKLYPKKLKNVTSYFQLMWLTHSLKLDGDILIWFWIPIYYTKVPEEKLGKDELELHLKLKRNNKNFTIIFLCFLIYFITFWIIATEVGT